MNGAFPRVTLLAAVGMKGELGKNNALLWRLKGDLPFFKRVTTGSPVIMGRRTFESLPAALPGRLNLVLTGDPARAFPGAVAVPSPAAALGACPPGTEEVFIIGGGAVYALFLPLADRLLLTEAYASDPAADTFFPAFDPAAWDRTVLDTGGGLIRYERAEYLRK